MGERENKVKDIIKKYEDEKSKINKKYEAKPYDNEATKKEIEKIDKELKPLNNEIELLKRGLQNLREEEPNNKDVILQYEEQIKGLEQDNTRQELLKDKQEILEKSLAEKNRIEQENKEIDLENKQKELRVAEDKVRKELTQESIAIENDIEKLQLDMTKTLLEMRNFKYEYEEDTRNCINGDEYKKINEKYDKQQEQIVELKKAEDLCYTKLNEFKEKDAKRVEKINEVLNNKKQPKDRNIYSHSKDRVNAININAAEGKAYATTIQGKSKEIDIKEVIKNKKGMFKDLKINERIQSSNVKSKIRQFMIRKKINPVILEVIKDDGDEAINDYITSIIEGSKFKFDYEHNLENSTLSTKDHRFMNRIALAESKIEKNEVKGAEKFYTIKNLFTKAKSKVKMIGKKEVLSLNEGKKTKQPKENKFKKTIKDMSQEKDDIIEKKIEEREEKIQDAYGDLTEDQKKQIENYSTKNDNDIDALQRLGLDYSCAYGIIEKYGNQTSKNKNNQSKETEKGD